MNSPKGTCTVRKSKDDSCDYRGGIQMMGYLADERGKMRYGVLVYDLHLDIAEDNNGKFMLGPVTLADFIEQT
jgi:hypothetical protein